MSNSRGIGPKAALAAMLVLGALSTPSLAAGAGPGGHRHGATHSGHQSCDWRGHSYAGTIVIDGCQTAIRGDCDIREEIARAFRRAGYRATCRNGQVVVDYGRCRPAIRWFADGYRASFCWERGSVSVSLFASECGGCSAGNTGGHIHRGRTVTRWTWSNRDHRRVWPVRRIRCD